MQLMMNVYLLLYFELPGHMQAAFEYVTGY
jgi:hypothetical protein